MALAGQREALQALGFEIVSATKRDITAVRTRWHWDCFFTRLTYVVFVRRIDQLTASVIDEDRAPFRAEAKKLDRSWLPRGMQKGVAVFACYIADHVDESAAQACTRSPRDFAAFYLPAAHDRSTRVNYFIRSTPIWGGLFYGKFRYLAGRLLSPREPHGREPLSLTGTLLTVLLTAGLLFIAAPPLLRSVVRSGCASDAGKCTRETLASAARCPSGQVEVRERTDVHASDFPSFIAAHAAEPPAEVTNDPDRLQRWLSEHEDRAARDNAAFQYLEASGCGRTVLYRCSNATPGAAWSAQWTCSESAYPEGVTKH